MASCAFWDFNVNGEYRLGDLRMITHHHAVLWHCKLVYRGGFFHSCVVHSFYTYLAPPVVGGLLLTHKSLDPDFQTSPTSCTLNNTVFLCVASSSFRWWRRLELHWLPCCQRHSRGYNMQLQPSHILCNTAGQCLCT